MVSFFGRKRKKSKEKSIEDMLKEEEELFEQEKKENLEETSLTENDILLENPLLQSEFTFDLEEDGKLLDKLIQEDSVDNNIDTEIKKYDDFLKSDTTEADLEKFDFIKEGEQIDVTEQNADVLINEIERDENSSFEIEQILDFSDDKSESEELISELSIADTDAHLNMEKIEEIFTYLKEKCGVGFLSGVLIDDLNARELYNYKSNNDIFSIFISFYQKLEEQVLKSEFEKQKNFYLVDLKDNQILFVLTYKMHHFVLTFDKTKISVGFIIYIIKSNIDLMYENALIN